jgi:predicted CopG family antitoxin
MATKNISITEEAYRRLFSLKKKNESFSQIIIKITGKTNLRNFFGTLSKESSSELETNINRGRKENKNLSDNRYKNLFGKC